MLGFFFALDKGLAIVRQIVIARLFGLSAELDAFNVANNIPDLIFALITGGALAVAFIPVLAEVLTLNGRQEAWRLFSRIANLAFLVTGAMSLLVAVSAGWLVGWELGIAPGFDQADQLLVTELMRLNLIATMLFSISGLVMAGLQANQHFFLPALAPVLYNAGQIFGAAILSPQEGIRIGALTLPAYGMGVHGLVYGVIIGAALHLLIQVPALIQYEFKWMFGVGLREPSVVKVLRLMGPRLATMAIIQMIFLIRDNLASRLQVGTVTALAYGWMIQQVPETLIGTAIGTALLPTLAEHFSRKNHQLFTQTVSKAIQVLLAVTLPVAGIMSVSLRPLLTFAFGFDAAGTDLLLWVTRGYLLGLTGHCMLELAARAFYARQNALVPLAGAVINVSIYIGMGSILFRVLGGPGISLTDAIAFTTQAVFLVIVLYRSGTRPLNLNPTWLRSILAALVCTGVAWLILSLTPGVPEIWASLLAMLGGALVMVFLIFPEIRLLLRL